MNKVNLNLECDNIGEVETSYYDSQLKVSLKNVNEDQLIGEILDNVSIERLLMDIDPDILSNEIQRRLEEDEN